MAKPDWGVKRTCPNCAARFYDLLRDPVICPSCSESFALEVFSRLRRGKASAPAAAKPVKPKVLVDADELEVEDLEDAVEDDDDDVLDLGDDDEEELAPPADAKPAPDDDEVVDFVAAEALDDGEEDDAVVEEDEDVSLDALGEEELDDDEDPDAEDDAAR